MENAKLQNSLLKFVRQVLDLEGERPDARTINDLRLGIRSVRMSEISDWSNDDLDEIEVYASRFDGDAPLESALEQSTHIEPARTRASAASICSPSPVAWM